jgi:hypothetical protein
MEELLLKTQQNQYCENGYATENTLYVQCNPYQNFNDILQETEKSIETSYGNTKDLK